MIEFVRNAFRVLISILLWLNLIVCTFLGVSGGLFFGKLLPFVYSNEITGIVIGGILGALIGLLLNILVGGFLATILNIDKNLQKMANKSIAISYSDKKQISADGMKNNEGYKQKSDTANNNDDAGILQYVKWKKENPDKTIQDYYASKRK
ncbi:MAG: hypothetical protein LBE91_13525 [Tannerella sp.]|jgi:hypothetical protein|nr:hypothetical protein [Tannerella sp.]